MMWNERVNAKRCIIMCKLKGRIDNEGHYDVEMKGWMVWFGLVLCGLMTPGLSKDIRCHV